LVSVERRAQAHNLLAGDNCAGFSDVFLTEASEKRGNNNRDAFSKQATSRATQISRAHSPLAAEQLPTADGSELLSSRISWFENCCQRAQQEGRSLAAFTRQSPSSLIGIFLVKNPGGLDRTNDSYWSEV
jgi:hypothetical protein